MGGFSVYAAMGEGFKAAIQGLEARIEDIAHEMQEQAEKDAIASAAAANYEKNATAAFNKYDGSNLAAYKGDGKLGWIEFSNAGIKGADAKAMIAKYGDMTIENLVEMQKNGNIVIDSSGKISKGTGTLDDGSNGESTTLLSIDMQRFIQEWSFLLTNATNAMKTYGDGLMSLARNL